MTVFLPYTQNSLFSLIRLFQPGLWSYQTCLRCLSVYVCVYPSLYMRLFASQPSDAIIYLHRTKIQLKSHRRPSQTPNKAERDRDRVAMFVPLASCLQAFKTPHPSKPYTLPPFLPKTNSQVWPVYLSPTYFISRFTPPQFGRQHHHLQNICVVHCQFC